MKINKVHVLYFSPTDTTKKTLQNIALGIGVKDKVEVNLTKHTLREKNYSFTSNDLVLIGAPVYSGRIPKVFADYLGNIAGNNTPIVSVVVYGNREYDDALAEFKDIVRQQGFIPIAAAAYIGEHSLSAEIATNRPDEEDKLHQISFGKKIESILTNNTDLHKYNLKVKGNIPTSPKGSNSSAPVTKQNCISCGVCVAECPVQAITKESITTDSEKCILCFRCVRLCPEQARYLNNDQFTEKINNMAKRLTVRKQPEIFI